MCLYQSWKAQGSLIPLSSAGTSRQPLESSRNMEWFSPHNVWQDTDPHLKGSQMNASKWHHPSFPVADVSWPSAFPTRDKGILTLQAQSYQFTLNSKLANSFQDKMNYSRRDHGLSTKDEKAGKGRKLQRVVFDDLFSCLWFPCKYSCFSDCTIVSMYTVALKGSSS